MGRFHRIARASAVVAIGMAGLLTAPTGAIAQQAPGGINPGRDCKTIVTCNFKKGGSYRGCLSSYSCRICRPVFAQCSIGGARGKLCHELQCSWG